jgi:hypothetical protein
MVVKLGHLCSGWGLRLFEMRVLRRIFGSNNRRLEKNEELGVSRIVLLADYY